MKKLNALVASCLFFFLLANVAHAANLSVPEHLQIVTINGEKQQWYLLMDKDDYPLNEGINTISVRYRDLIESDYDDTHQTVTSEPVQLTFNAVSGQTYTLTAARPESEDAASAFAKKPKIDVTQQGQHIELLKPIYTAASRAAPITATEHPVSRQIQQTQATPPPNTAATAAKMLRYWWQQADPATQQAFLNEVESQAN
ncbi:DUF2057 domain-containing protein [Neiella marina]|uniref:DUF2057 domain-containing protein n=1 Tax=Neiella holothuriorum TaxID=2870530 RepID=A0ABS7EGJ3_9GAMM|nr:DUF2057 domain-containing protein [Neiella holothuriorum]MBW8190916.1 DUF2057 domain-containing protein [Neiella holothuriorum]